MTVGRALTLRLGNGRLTAHPPTMGIIASLLGSGDARADRMCWRWIELRVIERRERYG